MSEEEMISNGLAENDEEAENSSSKKELTS